MAAPLLPKGTDSELDAPEFIQRGKILIVRRQYQEAVKVCRLGLLAHPTYVEGRLVLGMALVALARHDEVLAEMRVALELDPDNPMAHVLKGEALFHKRDYEQAREVLEHARELDPLNDKIRKLLEEIEDVADFGHEPGARVRTETKVYPAQRGIDGPFDQEPSDVLDQPARFKGWEDEEDDEEELTETDDVPPANVLAVRAEHQAVTREVEGEGEEEDEEFTTAPFLPPTHLGQRLKILEASEWMEPTISEQQPGGTSSAPAAGDLTMEHDSGVEKIIVDLGSDATVESQPDEDYAWDDGSDVEVPLAAPASDQPVYEEDPTLIPGEIRSGAPPLGEVGQLVTGEEEDEDTVVNADAPPQEALFGEELERSQPRWTGEGIPRGAQDPTKALGLAPESEEQFDHDLPPPESEVAYVSGVDVEEAGTREVVSGDRYRLDYSDADIYSDEVQELQDQPVDPFEVLRDEGAEGSVQEATPDPFEMAAQAGVAYEPADDLSEISVEMLPDDFGMPPVPPDARDSSLYDLSEPAPMEEAFGELLPDEGEPRRSEDSDQATRVKFDALDHDPLLDGPLADDGAFGFEARFPDPLPYPEEPFHPGEPPGHYGEPPGHYGEPGHYDEPPYPASGYSSMGVDHQASTMELPHEDEDELSLEPADDSADHRWAEGQQARTAPLDSDDGRAFAYLDQGPHEHTSETRPEGPQGIRGARQRHEQSGPYADDGMLEQMTGDSGLFARQASTHIGQMAAKVRRPRERAPDGTVTSWLTILVGEPGSHRWVYLLLSALGVLALAVAVGLAVRYYRLGEQVEAKRKQAEIRLRAGNMADFWSAANSYLEILNRRPDDPPAKAAHARILAAIPVEFGDAIPPTHQRHGEPEGRSPDAAAAEIYTHLYGGSLQRAGTLILDARKRFPESALLPYLAGRIALLEGNAAAAARHLKEAHQRDGQDSTILRALGESQAALGETEAALVSFRKALSINANHIGALLGLARMRVSTRESVDEAQLDLNSIVVGKRKGVASRGQRGWAYLILARYYFNKGQLDQAKSQINQARSNAPSRDAVFQDELASVLIDAFQLGEAEKAIRQSKEIMKGRPQPFYHMARIRLLHGRPRAALEELTQAKGLQYAASNLLRAQIHLELGQLREAGTEVDRALGMAGEMLQAHVVKAKVLAAEGRGRDAEEKLKSLLLKHPNSAPLLTACGEILLSLGRTAEARAKLQAALRQDPQAWSAQLKLAEVYIAEGNFVDARKSLSKAVRANSGNVMVLMKQAELEFDIGDLAEASTNYYEARRRAPNDPNIRLALARVLTYQRKFRPAEQEIRSAAAHGGAHDALALARGRLALLRAMAPAAVQELQTATKERPDDQEGWDLLVRAHLANGNDVTSARHVATEIQRRFAGTPTAVVAAAQVDLADGRAGDAIRRLRPLVAQQSRNRRPPRALAELLVLLGKAYRDNERLSDAASRYDEAIGVCPLCPEPYYNKGLVQDERGQVDEAIGNLKKALELDPAFAEVFYDLGQIYARAGQTAKAIDAYEKFLDSNPPKDMADTTRTNIQALKSGGW